MKFRCLFIIGMLLVLPNSWGQSSGGDFTLTRSVIAGGGGVSTGGGFLLRGTTGQLESGTSTGGNFSLRGGFWVPSEPLPEQVFFDGFET